MACLIPEDITARVVWVMGREERGEATTVPQQYEFIVKAESEPRSYDNEHVGEEPTQLAVADSWITTQATSAC